MRQSCQPKSGNILLCPLAHFCFAVDIRAEVEPGAFDGLLKLYIDDQLVINQRSKAFGGSSQSFTGTWRGKPVVARATQVSKMMSTYVMVDVFINGALVETLTI